MELIEYIGGYVPNKGELFFINEGKIIFFNDKFVLRMEVENLILTCLLVDIPFLLNFLINVQFLLTGFKIYK